MSKEEVFRYIKNILIAVRNDLYSTEKDDINKLRSSEDDSDTPCELRRTKTSN